LSWSCILCTQCRQFLLTVHFLFPLWCSLALIFSILETRRGNSFLTIQLGPCLHRHLGNKQFLWQSLLHLSDLISRNVIVTGQ
jgi:hypothetical protein